MTTLPTNWSTTDRASLEVHLLGTVDFESALFLQERLVYDISGREDRQGALLLCEHPPLVTVGREGSRSHILAEPAELSARLIGVRWSNRGGGCMVHGPGQLAVYPIVPLDRLGLGVSRFRGLLEEAVVETCSELRVRAWRNPDEPGVWCRCGQVAQVGIAVKSWVSYHGLFVNVSPSPDLLRLVRSSRSQDGRATSLATQRMRTTGMHAVREGLIRHLAERLGFERWHVYTGHPLLRRTRRKVQKVLA